MLPPFIIEQIRQREEEEQSGPRPQHLELPLAPRSEPTRRPARESEESQRGVVVIDLV